MIKSEEAYEHMIGHKPACGLRDFYVSDDVSSEFLASLKTANETDVWTHGFAVVHLESRLVIGSCGFKGPPSQEGAAEIAYGIVPDYQRRGYATEAALALVDFALDNGVRLARAHTLPEENASTRVLTKCGFNYVGEVIDPDDGPVWRWEKKL